VGFPVEEGGEPPPGSLFAAIRLVPAVPGLLLCVLVKFPLDLPQLAQQPDEDGSGLRASGHLRAVPQAQAVGFLQHTQDARIAKAGTQQRLLTRRGALADPARAAVTVVDHPLCGNPGYFLRRPAVGLPPGNAGRRPAAARCAAETAEDAGSTGRHGDEEWP
jgi:hypothetical protein